MELFGGCSEFHDENSLDLLNTEDTIRMPICSDRNIEFDSVNKCCTVVIGFPPINLRRLKSIRKITKGKNLVKRKLALTVLKLVFS